MAGRVVRCGRHVRRAGDLMAENASTTTTTGANDGQGPGDGAKKRAAAGHPTGRVAATVGALGVVFGDIGTSPIYTIQTVFSPSDPHPVSVGLSHVYGVISLIFWSVTAIVTITYITLVMRADNDGEGGIMALITL